MRHEIYQNGVLITEEEIADVPRTELYPFEFLSLLTAAQIVAIQTSGDPLLIILKSKLQTIVSPMPFVPGSELYDALNYMGFALPELFTENEITRIVAQQMPE